MLGGPGTKVGPQPASTTFSRAAGSKGTGVHAGTHMQGRDSPKEVYGLSPEPAKGHKGANPLTKGNYLD